MLLEKGFFQREICDIFEAIVTTRKQCGDIREDFFMRLVSNFVELFNIFCQDSALYRLCEE